MGKQSRRRRAPRLTEWDNVTVVPAGVTNLELVTVLAFGLAFSLAVLIELGGTTPEGTIQLTHWTPWRELSIFHTALVMLPPLPLIAWVLWRAGKDPTPPPAPLLCVLALASLALQALGLLADPRGLGMVSRIVQSPATGYFADAVPIRSILAWLQHFHEIPLRFHSQTHPPGPILFYYTFVKWFGESAASTAGGWTIGILTSAGVPVMYLFSGLWTKEVRPRLTAAAFYALIPALTLFFPEFDQAYPLLSMLLVICWMKGLETGKWQWSAGAGAVLFLASFFAYNLLTMGSFLVLSAIYWSRKRTAGPVLRAGGIALAVFAGLYLTTLAPGYHPASALERSLAAQALFAKMLNRPYERFIFFDVYDLFLGAGMLAFPLLVFHLRRKPQPLTWIALATILTVDLSGALRGETARVWLFLQPLLVVPVALELDEIPPRWKLAIFALQWWVLVCLKAKMTFLEP